MDKKHKFGMKLTAKMIILFLIIIFVPTIAAVMVFLGFGYHENIDIFHELSKEGIMIGEMVGRSFLKHFNVIMIAVLIVTSVIITSWIK